MKKFFTLFASVVMAVTAFAQTVLLDENFSTITTGNNTSSNGSGTTWAGNANFPTVDSAYNAGGAVKIGTGSGSSSSGSITSKSLDLSTDGGQFKVEFDVKGWTTVEGNIVVTVTGLTSQTKTYTAVMGSSNFEHITLNFTGGTANSTIKIATSTKRAFIDNVLVTTVPSGPSLATNEVKGNKNVFVKNTLVDSEINFGANSDIKIYNLNGQVVKEAKVSADKALNVQELSKGTYIVTGTVNGNKVSEKIIKK